MNSLHRYRPGEHGCAICGRNSNTHPSTQGGNTMHQDTHRVDTAVIETPAGKKPGKRCLTCGTQIWLDIQRKGRQPRFCTTTCQKQIHAEIRRLRSSGDTARADLLANPRTTWEQANG